MEEKIYCSHCGEIIEDDNYDTIYGEPICEDCVDRYTTVCDRCEEIVWDDAMKAPVYVIAALRTTTHAVRSATV